MTIEDQLADLLAGQRTTNELLGKIHAAQNEPHTPTDPDEPGTDPTDPGTPLVVLPLDGVPIVDVLPIAADWTLTLPIPKPNTTPAQNSPWNDYPDRLVNGRAPGLAYAAMVGGRRAVVFDVPDPNDGVTTKSSKYPRSELREMIAGARWEEAARDSADPFVCTAELAIVTAGLSTRPRVVGWQIHGGDDDVCQLIATEDDQLGVSWRDGKEFIALREHYTGEPFRLRVESLGKVPGIDGRLVQGPVQIKIDDERPLRISPGAGSGWFVKAGAYAQTGGKSDHREPASAFGRVIYWALDVQPRAV